MTNGIPSVLIDKGLKTLIVVIINLFPLFHLVVQLIGVGPTAKEGVPQVQGLRELVILEERSNGRVGLTLTFPLALPHGFDQVPVFTEHSVLFFVSPEHIVHHLPQVSGMGFVPLGKARGTPVPEAPVEFVDGVGVWVVAVHGVTMTRDGRVEFAPVMRVS